MNLPVGVDSSVDSSVEESVDESVDERAGTGAANLYQNSVIS